MVGESIRIMIMRTNVVDVCIAIGFSQMNVDNHHPLLQVVTRDEEQGESV